MRPHVAPMELALSRLLRAGVVLAATVACAGAALFLYRHGAEISDHSAFRGEPHDLASVAGILKSVLHVRARGILQLAILLLILTPVARVAFSLVAFLMARDVLYILVTAFVLTVLLLSLTY